MVNSFKTEQELFWAGEFGGNYIDRNNKTKHTIASQINLFSKVLSNTKNIKTAIEFGANIGLNLHAIQTLLPYVEISAIEINHGAVEELKKNQKFKVYHTSILDFIPDYKRDLVFIKGVLIHINPDFLQNVYDLLYKTSNKYICVAEYYNPAPVELKYRGHSGKLFKRDFAGEMLDKYSDLSLIDYGFVYHRDNNFPDDDINWFLLEKK